MPVEVVNLLIRYRIRLLTISSWNMKERGEENDIKRVIDIRNIWSSSYLYTDRAICDQPFLLEKFIYVKLFVLEEQRTVWNLRKIRGGRSLSRMFEIPVKFSQSWSHEIPLLHFRTIIWIYRNLLFSDFFISEVQQLYNCIIDKWFI